MEFLETFTIFVLAVFLWGVACKVWFKYSKRTCRRKRVARVKKRLDKSQGLIYYIKTIKMTRR